MNQKRFNAKTQGHKDAKRYLTYFCAICCLLIASCIPAHEPDNLRNTPGAPVVVDDNLYRGAAFSAKIPSGWRVITGEARASQSVIFVAPDGKTLIRLIAGNVEADAVRVSNQRNEIVPVTLANATIVTTVFSSPYSTWASYLPDFDRVRDSLSSR